MKLVAAFSTILALHSWRLTGVRATGESVDEHRGRRRLKPQNPCILTQFHVQFEPENPIVANAGAKGLVAGNGKSKGEPVTHSAQGEPFWLCEVQGADVKLVGAAFVEVPSLNSSFYEDHEIESGSTTLVAQGAVYETNATSADLIIPEGVEPVLGTVPSSHNLSSPSVATGGRMRGRRHLAEGTRSVLVIRITSSADGSTTSLNEASLAAGVFTDAVNLKSQSAACSYGKLNFVPATGTSITAGVTTVTVNVNVQGALQRPVRKAAEAAAIARYGDLASKFNHVMFCIPPGTVYDEEGGGWIAYAGVNSWYSAYNDKWCSYVSVQMHELGHNYGLSHSGESDNEYGDNSCMMGSSYSSSDTPVMCYNSQKSWDLGWYADRSVQLDPPVGSTNSLTMIGVDDYGTSTAAHTVGVRLESGDRDYFIGYNRAAGINVGTQESKNMVTIVRRGTDSDYSDSYLQARLNPSEVFQIPNYKSGQTLFIRFTKTDTSVLKSGAAMVDIYYASCVPPGCTTNPSPPSPPTKAPTTAPIASPTTKTPTKAPTKAPTPVPTKAPTKVPTTAPTKVPTKPPTKPTVPTRLPTNAPTRKPTKAPTKKPSAPVPTTPPTRNPTNAPTKNPTKAPTKSPTPQPTSSPPTSPPGGCPPDKARFDFNLHTDDHPEDTSWTLKDSAGTELGTGSGYLSNTLFNLGPFCLDRNAEYEFQFNDSYGDGLCCGSTNNGWYSGILDGTEIFYGEEFSDLTVIHIFQTGSTSNGCPTDNARFDLTLTTDDYGEDISWTLKDGSGNVIQSGTGYEGTSQTYYIGPYCLPRNAPYKFEMLDSYGDGLGSGGFSGSLDGVQIFAGGEFTTDITVDFTTPSSSQGTEIGVRPQRGGV